MREEERGGSRELLALERKFEEWRSQYGGPGRKLPDSLWAQAATVAGECGVSLVAQALRVCGVRLERRLRNRDQADASGSDGGPASAFVDVGFMPSLSGIVIEMEGTQVRIRLPVGSAMAEVAGLARLLAEVRR